MKMRFGSSLAGCIGSSMNSSKATRWLTSGTLLLCLTVFVPSCKTVEYVTVEKPVYLRPQAALTRQTPGPETPLFLTESNGELLTYALACEASLQMCNNDKLLIQEAPLPQPPAPPEPASSWLPRLFRDE